MSTSQAGPPAASEQGNRNLMLRIAAALVLAPVAIGTAYAGGWIWSLLVTLAAIGLYLEWLGIVGAAGDGRIMVGGVAVLATAGLCFATGHAGAAVVVTAAGLVGVAVGARQPQAWLPAGLAYAGIAQAASIMVRYDETRGFVALAFVLMVVWASDIGGYFAGRGFGGPKLWPSVSPKKTWSGAIGGLVASMLVGTVFPLFGSGLRFLPLILLAAGLSVVSQLGDLFESAVKRRFGVKDSSQIIPGHGGLMDRLDGFIAAIAVAAVLGWLRADADGIARGLMVW